MVEVLILKKRKDFVRVASQGFKMVSSGLILQAAQSLSTPENSCQLGYTATKKIGKAHIRNRTKRRLRAAARELFPQYGRPDTDYVLIGRFNTATCDFGELRQNMAVALKRINKMFSVSEEKTDDKNITVSADSRG